MAKPAEKFEVEILRVDEIVTYPVPDQPFVTHAVTYRHGDLPPRTVFIPAKEDTPQNRAKIIHQDIEAELKRKPETMMV